ncbi:MULTISPECIES: glycosyltransferase family 2 protein [unclassified Solwaraspora]|uniref:glycosyltransferase family 2 protein n=1 Tax=unclassified Solwaraspora TaxID=2627926 RepID=UPI00248B4E66|nr:MULTISPECIES: glycosyltransferase family 2 protein [unclassified Solwaraspora]WBB98771.1 glycosyltransferase family 2 protein [Solwaraspora sp. WMMA2059]WBC22676.1 glycosyltransferase family 2 protein [Solwaraspora sp. WMMA2080]WJK35275.1 glycosyltransferase family 2 protein [Solwaraspora sp. WMMA2065]
MADPLVSVIIPNYNYGNSIGRCVDAALDQTYRPIEVIVVDDHSTDDSLAIARQRAVTVLRTARNSGVAVARNMGAAAARGEILFFVDSDVALRPDAIETAVAELRAHPEYGAVCGIYEDEPLIRDSVVEQCRVLQAYCWRMASLGEVSFLFSSLTAIPRRVFDEVGPFNPRLRQTEEVDYGQRMSTRYQIRVTDAVRGWHDDDDKLLPLMRKLFRRARLRVPLFARRRRFAKGFESASRSLAALAALGVLASLPLVVLSPWALLATGALLAGMLAGDAAMYRYVLRRRGAGFLTVFTAVAFATNVAISTGIAVGVLQWLVSGRFRRLYDAQWPSTAVPAASTATGTPA